MSQAQVFSRLSKWTEGDPVPSYTSVGVFGPNQTNKKGFTRGATGETKNIERYAMKNITQNYDTITVNCPTKSIQKLSELEVWDRFNIEPGMEALDGCSEEREFEEEEPEYTSIREDWEDKPVLPPALYVWLGTVKDTKEVIDAAPETHVVKGREIAFYDGGEDEVPTATFDDEDETPGERDESTETGGFISFRKLQNASSTLDWSYSQLDADCQAMYALQYRRLKQLIALRAREEGLVLKDGFFFSHTRDYLLQDEEETLFPKSNFKPETVSDTTKAKALDGRRKPVAKDVQTAAEFIRARLNQNK